MDKIDSQVAHDLTNEKSPKILLDLPELGKDWKVQCVLFGINGFTQSAKNEMRDAGGLLT